MRSVPTDCMVYRTKAVNKNNYVSGAAAGFIFAKRKMDNIFLPKKKKCGEKKKEMQPPDWPQFWPPAGQETHFFFMDSQRLHVSQVRRNARGVRERTSSHAHPWTVGTTHPLTHPPTPTSPPPNPQVNSLPWISWNQRAV